MNTIRALLGVLDHLVFQATERVRERPVPAAAKRLSLHDTDARPMSKGTTLKGTQFGYTAQIAEDATGLIIDYGAHIGQPGDSDLIGPAIQAIAATLRPPPVVTADKTYGAAHARVALTEAGVSLVAITSAAVRSSRDLAPDYALRAAAHPASAIRRSRPFELADRRLGWNIRADGQRAIPPQAQRRVFHYKRSAFRLGDTTRGVDHRRGLSRERSARLVADLCSDPEGKLVSFGVA